jgi:DNA-binding CsgD family transcriptional regulator
MYNLEAYKLHESKVSQVIGICETIKSCGLFANIKTISYNKTFYNCSYINLINGYTAFAQQYCGLIIDRGKNFINAIHNTQNDKPYILIWPNDAAKSDPLLSLVYEHNIWNGVSLLFRTNDGIETISLAGDKESTNVPNLIINNMEVILDCVNYFRQRISLLTESCTSNTYGIYKNKFDMSFKGEPTKFVHFNNEVSDIKLSLRESQCFELLCRGYSMKKTANILGLSPRTIETTINNVKSKTNLRYKSELIDLYYERYNKLINNFNGIQLGIKKGLLCKQTL